MSRRTFFIILLSVVVVLYLHGMNIFRVEVQTLQSNDTIFTPQIESLLDSFKIPESAFNMALNGFYDLKSKNLIKNDSIIALIDFSKPSNDNRFFIIDIKNNKVIKNTLVAHGMQSGNVFAESFSNSRLSYKSSLGLYVTGETYDGKHGYSLRLNGMSKGLNDNAYKRAVVIHGANYVSEDYIKRNGRLGRSFGCPAVPEKESKDIIDLIKNGTCLYIYHPSLIPISQAALEKLP